MLQEKTIRELAGDRLPGAEVDHVDGAGQQHLRKPHLDGGVHSGRAGGHGAAHDLIGDLRRRQVEHELDPAIAHERLGGPATAAARVEGENLVAGGGQKIEGCICRGRRGTEGRYPHARRRSARRNAFGLANERTHYRGRPVQKILQVGTDPEDVDHGMDEHDILGTDDARRISGHGGGDE